MPAVQETVERVKRIDVDAAILFSDLLLPLEHMGIPFDFVKGEGPAIERPLRSEDDLAAVRRFEPRDALAHVLTAIGQIKREAPDMPLYWFLLVKGHRTFKYLPVFGRSFFPHWAQDRGDLQPLAEQRHRGHPGPAGQDGLDGEHRFQLELLTAFAFGWSVESFEH